MQHESMNNAARGQSSMWTIVHADNRPCGQSSMRTIVHADNHPSDICPEGHSSNSQFFNRLICIQKKRILTTIPMQQSTTKNIPVHKTKKLLQNWSNSWHIVSFLNLSHVWRIITNYHLGIKCKNKAVLTVSLSLPMIYQSHFKNKRFT